MTHPPFRTRPLLIHTLAAAALLCPPAFAKTKPETQKKEEAKPAPAASVKKTAAAPVSKAAAKPQTRKPAVVPAPAPAAVKAAPVKALVATPSKTGQQTQGDGKSTRKQGGGRPPQYALIADPEELLSRVPTAGPLGEEHLILLAIATDPRLARSRAAIASARADKRKAQDFESPELRLSYGSQDDNYVRRPYQERTIQQYNATETETGTDSTTSLAQPGELGFGDSTLDTNSSTTSTDRYREIVRTITPTKNGGEEITTTTYELQKEDSTGIRDRVNTQGDLSTSRSDALASNVTRELVSTTHESTTSSQRGNASSTFSALVRFKIPHPGVRKALIQRASAEIMLAEAKYLADEDRLVREIRERYEKLCMEESSLGSYRKIQNSYSEFQKKMDADAATIPAIDAANFTAESIRARMDVKKSQLKINDASMMSARLRAEIAMLCGLPDTTRIRSGSMTRRIVNPKELEVPYLVDLAMIYRADAVESRGRLEIAKAHLAEANAAKIPFASFIDAGFSRETADDRYGDQKEWTVRIGIDVPIWDWMGINKRSKEYKKAAVAWESQFDKQRYRISSDITLAINRLKAASTMLSSYDKDLKELRSASKAALKRAEESLNETKDYPKFIRDKYSFEVLEQDTEISRYEAYSEYNQALMALEAAIGVRLEKVLDGKPY